MADCTNLEPHEYHGWQEGPRFHACPGVTAPHEYTAGRSVVGEIPTCTVCRRRAVDPAHT